MKKVAIASLIIVVLASSSGAQRNTSSTTPRHCSVEKGSKELPYPDSLRGSGIQGTVLIEAVIGVGGCASSVEVVRKLNPELDRLAKEAADSWKFKAATKDGKPVIIKVQIAFDFKDPGK